MATGWISRFCCRPLPRPEGQNFSQTMVDVGFIEFRVWGCFLATLGNMLGFELVGSSTHGN